jgi:hypothetical protein
MPYIYRIFDTLYFLYYDTAFCMKCNRKEENISISDQFKSQDCLAELRI